MDAAAHAPLHALLLARRAAIADRWYRAVARTGFAPLGGPEVRARLLALSDRAIAALLADPFTPGEARAVGAALADLHYLRPAALEGTLTVLGEDLAAAVPPEALPTVQPRLATLLGAVAHGYYAAARETILAEQEAARAPLLAEQQRSEAALRASEARLRAVVANSPVTLFALDRDGVFTFAEGKGLVMLGLTREQIIGQPVEDLFAAVPTLARDVRRALAGQDCLAIAEVGEVVLEARHTPVRDETGAVVEVIGVATDITARQRAEERLRTVITNAPVVLFAVDLAGTVTLAEGRGLAPLGLRSGEIVGQSLFDLYRDAPEVLANVRRALGGETFDTVVEVAGASFETRYAPLRDATGAVTGASGVATDVTARVRAEAERDQARQRLLASREAAQLEIARELHDGPVQELLGIRYGLQASRERVNLLRPELADTLDEWQEQILTVVAQLRGLIGELRPAGLEDFGLPGALEEYTAQLRREQVAALPAITLDLDPRGSTLPLAVAHGLFRMAQEALRNVLMHARARQTVVTLHCQADVVTLSVLDDGRGFVVPPRLGGLAREGHFGLIGLAERAEWLGGHCTISSIPGAGTAITVRLPLVREEGDDDRADPGAASR